MNGLCKRCHSSSRKDVGQEFKEVRASARQRQQTQGTESWSISHRKTFVRQEMPDGQTGKHKIQCEGMLSSTDQPQNYNSTNSLIASMIQ